MMFLMLSLISFSQTKEKTFEVVKNESEKLKENVYSVSKNVSETKEVVKNQTSSLRQDIKDGISTIHSDVTEATKYITPKAEALLKNVFDKVGNTTIKLWEIIVKQQKVMSWCYLILFIISGISFISISRKVSEIKKLISNKIEDELKEKSLMKFNYIVLFCSVVIFSVSSYHAIPNLGKMMTGFINPEFGAIEQIYEKYQIEKNSTYIK